MGKIKYTFEYIKQTYKQYGFEKDEYEYKQWLKTKNNQIAS
jgi:hypothetical protein